MESASNGAVNEAFSILGCLRYFGEGHVGGAEVSLGGFEDEDVPGDGSCRRES